MAQQDSNTQKFSFLEKAGDGSAPTSGTTKIGTRMPDGTVYAGASPETGNPMYATPTDAPLTMTFNEAKGYAAKLHAHGQNDWRVPTMAELNVLFNHRAVISGFDETGSYPAGRYWSCEDNLTFGAWAQRFSDGDVYNGYGVYPFSVRLVRDDGPKP